MVWNSGLLSPGPPFILILVCVCLLPLETHGSCPAMPDRLPFSIDGNPLPAEVEAGEALLQFALQSGKRQEEVTPWRIHYKPVKPDDFLEKDWPYDANNDLEAAAIARKVGSKAPLVIPERTDDKAAAIARKVDFKAPLVIPETTNDKTFKKETREVGQVQEKYDSKSKVPSGQAGTVLGKPKVTATTVAPQAKVVTVMPNQNPAVTVASEVPAVGKPEKATAANTPAKTPAKADSAF